MPGDLHLQIDAVPDRARQTGAVPLTLGRRALTRPLRVCGEAAGARIGSRHQDEAAWQNRMTARPRDRDPAFFQRLPQRFQRITPELGDLIQEQHAAMGAGDLTRLRHRPTATNPRGK